jgi:hypothetical protein
MHTTPIIIMLARKMLKDGVARSPTADGLLNAGRGKLSLRAYGDDVWVVDASGEERGLRPKKIERVPTDSAS